MTHDPDRKNEPEPGVPPDDDAADAVRSLVRRAAARGHPDAPELLARVQRRIRRRSRGKFYRDAWSTSPQGRSTFVVTSVLMLVVLLLFYFALMPGGPLK